MCAFWGAFVLKTCFCLSVFFSFQICLFSILCHVYRSSICCVSDVVWFGLPCEFCVLLWFQVVFRFCWADLCVVAAFSFLFLLKFIVSLYYKIRFLIIYFLQNGPPGVSYASLNFKSSHVFWWHIWLLRNLEELGFNNRTLAISTSLSHPPLGVLALVVFEY